MTIQSSGTLPNASAYRPVIVAYRNGSPVRLEQVANVVDSVDNTKLVAFRGLLERKQKLIGRQSRLADVILAMESPDYRFSADAE